MSCRKYQFLIGTEESTALAANAELQAHLRACPDCARLLAEMTQLSTTTRLLEALPTPAGLSARIATEVRRTEQSQSRSWWQRFLGPLRAPAPALQTRHVFAGIAVILLAFVLVAVLIHPAAPVGTTPTFSVPSIAQPGGGTPVDYRPPATMPVRGAQPPAHAP